MDSVFFNPTTFNQDNKKISLLVLFVFNFGRNQRTNKKYFQQKNNFDFKFILFDFRSLCCCCCSDALLKKNTNKKNENRTFFGKNENFETSPKNAEAGLKRNENEKQLFLNRARRKISAFGKFFSGEGFLTTHVENIENFKMG